MLLITLIVLLNILKVMATFGSLATFKFPSLSDLPAIRFPQLIGYQSCTGPLYGQEGLCKNAIECDSENGIADGTCALGLGVCCLTTVRCGQTSSFGNNTFFINNDYPNPTTTSQLCLANVNLLPDVSQILLQFIEFDLLGPIEGECIADAFRAVVIKDRVFSPRLCGNGKGLYTYLPVEPQVQSVKLIIGTSGESYGRTWMIKITQYQSDNKL